MQIKKNQRPCHKEGQREKGGGKGTSFSWLDDTYLIFQPEVTGSHSGQSLSLAISRLEHTMTGAGTVAVILPTMLLMASMKNRNSTKMSVTTVYASVIVLCDSRPEEQELHQDVTSLKNRNSTKMSVRVYMLVLLFSVTAALKNRNSTMMAFSPADCGDGCPGVSEPLCAGDPVTPPLTFGSPCQLKQYNCRKKRSLEVIQQGPCDDYIEEPRPSRKGIGRPPTPFAQDFRNKLVLTSRGDTAKPGGTLSEDDR
uniref:Kazal-like domain-containing protein n=1 Tax=Timema tahoe TaxID=61484 RepID=A0A7R9I8Z5_9NEOP|nr:unnamed protein product [Timema tahoe]